MYLNDENDFEETQLAEDRLQEDPKAAVRTWQIFIYCRNRKLSVKVPNTRSPIRRDASSQSNGSATSHVNAGPSNATAQPAAEDSSPSSSPGSVQVTGNDTSFPPIQLPPDDIYRHPKEANCPAQISAFLQVDTRNLGRSLW